MRAIVITLLSCVLLAGCERGTSLASTPAAASAANIAGDRVEGLDTFLREHYGAAASLAVASWQADVDGAAVDSSVCARHTVTTDAGNQQFLAICHTVRDAGHATDGLIDFWVLQTDGGSLTVSSELQAMPYGSNGVPGEVEVLRLGRELHGFIVVSSWTGQGISLGTRSLVLPGPDGLADAGWMRSSLDNAGEVTCADSAMSVPEDDDAPEDPGNHADCAAAFDLHFDLQVDDTDLHAEIWPLTVHEHGNACGTTVDNTHVIGFDTQHLRYIIPDDLLREACS